MTDMREVREILLQEIREKGRVRMDRFMEICLYSEGVGYYEKSGDRVGKEGDFFTSVSVGSVYGELLGAMLVEGLRLISGSIQIVEAGAHQGQLAFDILGYLREFHPDVFERLEYWILEPSKERQAWQRDKLTDYGERCRWFAGWLEVDDVRGAILSNELLDAFPIRSLVWRTEGWNEQFITSMGNGDLQVIENPLDVLDVSKLELEQKFDGVELPGGFPWEICVGGTDWWRAAAERLQAGVLLTADYGYVEEEWLEGGFPQGTLRGYKNHRQITNLTETLGEIDLTAHVNFSELESIGQAEGLETVEFDTQGQVLGRVLKTIEEEGMPFLEWTQKRTRQLQTLIFPQFLGAKFRILIQKRNSQ